jgi:hypothetical protein
VDHRLAIFLARSIVTDVGLGEGQRLIAAAARAAKMDPASFRSQITAKADGGRFACVARSFGGALHRAALDSSSSTGGVPIGQKWRQRPSFIMVVVRGKAVHLPRGTGTHQYRDGEGVAEGAWLVRIFLLLLFLCFSSSEESR